MTAYPSSEDYVRAVQRPDLTLRTAPLRRAVFETHPLFGIPMPASGNSAVVFKARVDGRDQALRFFIRDDASSRDRYTALDRHVSACGLTDCLASCAWVDDAIEISGRTWPLVRMEWIDGRTLDAYVGHLAERHDVSALHELAGHWRAGVHRMQAAEFAHGDLQHGNVMVDTAGAVRLVDFDGSWISAFAGAAPPNETGHPNYQRAGRIWGRWMDTFPGLVIYTGLLALSRRPDLWATLHNGENMLFSQDDFGRRDTRAWRMLDEIADPHFEHVLARLRACCGPGWTATGPLEDLLGREQVEVSRPRPELRTDDPDLPWWELTGAGTAATPTGMPPPPPKVGPGARRGDAAAPRFTGASASGEWHGRRTPEVPSAPVPAPAPTPAGKGKAIAGVAAIAVAAGLLVGVLANAAHGSGAAGGLLGALLAFVIGLAVVLSRGR
jgi:hypothetical protein